MHLGELVGEWRIHTAPKGVVRAKIATVPFPPDGFDDFLARAKALRAELGDTHHIHLEAPAWATDEQRHRIRGAGFDPG